MEHVQQAIISQANPYALWGKLVLSDEVNHVLENKIDDNYTRRFEGHYEGDAYIVSYKNKGGSSLYHFTATFTSLANEDNFSDFAFQTVVTMEDPDIFDHLSAGLFFRVDKSSQKGYWFHLSLKGIHVSDRRLLLIKKESPATEKSIDLFGIKDHRLTNASPIVTKYSYKEELPPQVALLAVVAQGPILDLYLDTKHIKRIADYSFSKGTIGIKVETNTQNRKIFFTGTKLWVK